MKRFRLRTLMWLIAIAALGFDLPRQAREVSRRGVEPEFRFAELQRVFMIVVAVTCFALARRAREESQRGIGSDAEVRIYSE
jgi:hypothetical protein